MREKGATVGQCVTDRLFVAHKALQYRLFIPLLLFPLFNGRIQFMI